MSTASPRPPLGLASHRLSSPLLEETSQPAEVTWEAQSKEGEPAGQQTYDVTCQQGWQQVLPTWQQGCA